MTPAESDFPTRHFRRIVLTLSLSGNERQDRALEHTVNFAGVFDSDVACLCIRDSDLLDYAGLPFAREFAFHSTFSRPLDPDDLRNEMDERASSIRQILEKLANAHQRRHSFAIVDGRLDEKVVESTHEDDLLVLSLSPQALRSFKKTYETITRIVSQRQCHILLVNESRQTPAGNVTLIAPEILPSDKAMKLALHIARQRHVGVDAYIGDVKGLAEAMEKLFEDIRDDTALRTTVGSLSQRLMHPWRKSSSSLMIIDYENDLPKPDILERSLEVFQAPVLLFRR